MVAITVVIFETCIRHSRFNMGTLFDEWVHVYQVYFLSYRMRVCDHPRRGKSWWERVRDYLGIFYVQFLCDCIKEHNDDVLIICSFWGGLEYRIFHIPLLYHLMFPCSSKRLIRSAGICPCRFYVLDLSPTWLPIFVLDLYLLWRKEAQGLYEL